MRHLAQHAARVEVPHAHGAVAGAGRQTALRQVEHHGGDDDGDGGRDALLAATRRRRRRGGGVELKQQFAERDAPDVHEAVVAGADD